jgi:hypothetical protein
MQQAHDVLAKRFPNLTFSGHLMDLNGDTV